MRDRLMCKTTITSILLLALAIPAQAQTGTCATGLADEFLDVNNVRARIVNNGGLVWRGSPHVYEVPKYGRSNAIFAAGLWIGGKVGGELRAAAARYGPWEFWPGPLDEQGNAAEDCAPFDHIYKVYVRDFTEYEETGIANDNLLNWPWELGAPVTDGDGIPDNYNLVGGDRPEIIGHQTLWWVMNDRGNIHESSDTDPIGLEIQVTAFAAASTNTHVDNATLYKYKLIYKGDAPFEDVYFGLFKDVDLGNFDDDYVGSDSTLGMAYAYNSDNLDEGGEGYGEAPPAVGFDFVQGPLVNNDGLDNDNDGQADEHDERLSMTSFMFYHSGGDVTGDPSTGSDYYNFLQGKWKDGKHLTLGGGGRDFSNIPASFMFSGDPVSGEGWSELNPDPFNGILPPHPPADRRSIMGSGPFTMQPGEEQEIVIAIVWGRGEDNLSSITVLREASVEVQNTYESGFEVALPDVEPLAEVQLLAPAHEAQSQPTDPTLHWHTDDTKVFYELQWSQDASFSDSMIEEVFASFSHKITGLFPESRYYWRVRSINAAEIGPWSPTWSFSTSQHTVGARTFSKFAFMAVQNAAGSIEPPDMAAFAFNQSGFPVLEGIITPVGSHPNDDRPTRGVQQSTNNSAWGIHAGENNSTKFDDVDGQSFIERVLRNGREPLGTDSYEWRFSQHCLDQINGAIEEADCLAFRAFDDSASVEIPFEIWNIRSVSDTTDDYRMIPFICEEACGAGIDGLAFDFAGDHRISGGGNDPFSDWIYWNKPADNGASPGQQGYLDFFFNGADAGDEVFAQMVLVQWNGGHMPPYEVELPEPGTIFRIKTDLSDSPLLAAPANHEIRTSKTTSLFWHAPPAQFQLQVDISPEFTAPVLDVSDLEIPPFETEDLQDDQTYYWRVRMFSKSGFQVSDWSETWQFTIPLNVGVDEDPEGPLLYALSQSYPNPFQYSTRIRYAIEKQGNVQLEVYDTLGRRIRVLINQQQPAGWHEASFDALGLSSGIYFYRLTADSFMETKSMILMR